MKAIGLWQPWLDYIVYTGRGRRKDVENRRVLRPLVGKDVAVYATRKAGDDVASVMAKVESHTGIRIPTPTAYGAITGVARLEAAVRETSDGRVTLGSGAWSLWRFDESPWYMGGDAYGIGRVFPLLNPVDFSGAQYPKPLSSTEEAAVRFQLDMMAALVFAANGRWPGAQLAGELSRALMVDVKPRQTLVVLPLGQRFLAERQPEYRAAEAVMARVWPVWS